MVFLTVFTPTYNRANTLHLNYEALKRQTDKDFVWMIVDDGSTDNTEEIVASWISEGSIHIDYYKQKNAGKAAATNVSIERSNSILWVCVDSDDYLSDDAVELIRREYQKASTNSRCAGMIGPRRNYGLKEGEERLNQDFLQKKAKCPDFVYFWELVYKYGMKDDMVLIFELSKLKKYRYPIIKGEKFIGESYIYEQIGTDFLFYIIGKSLYYCRYLEDGLTSNYLKLHVSSPQGYKLLKKQEMIKPKPIVDKFRAAIMYVAGSLLCNDKRIIRDSPKRILTFFAYPFGVIAYRVKYAKLIEKRKNNKKRVLIVAGCMNVGGLENQLMNLAYNLDTEKYSIYFTSDQFECDYKEEIIGNGWGYVFLPSTREVGIIKYCLELFKELKMMKYDIVHSHELFHSGLVMLVSFAAGVPVRISHSHSTNDDSAHRALSKRIYHHAMRLLIHLFATDYIACSSEAGEYLFGSRHKQKVKVIWNTIDTERFIKSNDALAIKNDIKQIVHVGRFVELKNQRFILQVAKKAKEHGYKYCFLFVGDGPTFEADKLYAQELGIDGYVKFLGNRSDVPYILHSSDLFVLPSQFEGMPLSLVEAQAAGLPCIVSDTITREVDFGLNLITWLSLEAPVETWVEAIEKAIQKPRLQADLIREAIQEKGFDNKEYARKISAVYQQ